LDGSSEKSHGLAEKKEICSLNDQNMAEHLEPEENEIAGPVLFALLILTISVIIIYFWSK
jgi:hypothetical protein